MKTKTLYLIILSMVGSFLYGQEVVDASSAMNDTIQAHFDVNQCDSLIQANALNPDFVIMDVRRPDEYIPEHLEGAINRDYYDPFFNIMLDALPRHKLYMIYCRSGGRSGQTYTMMLNMNFTRVVNMLGGILDWKAASFPTTSEFAPLLMAVSDTIVPMDTVLIGDVDTIYLTVTNRANDTLEFTGILPVSGTEFSTGFDTLTTLMGTDDYTFPVFYEPVDEISDTLDLHIASNGGDITFRIFRTGFSTVGICEQDTRDNITVFPNPVSNTLSIKMQTGEVLTDAMISLFNSSGRHIYQRNCQDSKAIPKIDVSHLLPGIYFVTVTTINSTSTLKIIKY